MKHFSTFGNEPTVLGAASRQTGHRVNISPETLHLENNLMMLLVKSGFISVTFAFAADGLLGDWAGRQKGWGRHLQKQGALAGQAAGELTEALARLWWCVRTTASTERQGKGVSPVMRECRERPRRRRITG